MSGLSVVAACESEFRSIFRLIEEAAHFLACLCLASAFVSAYSLYVLGATKAWTQEEFEELNKRFQEIANDLHALRAELDAEVVKQCPDLFKKDARGVYLLRNEKDEVVFVWREPATVKNEQSQSNI